MTNPLRTSLAGIRVTDLSVNLAGPYASMVLADLGAEVIKVERPEGGDDTRSMAPFWNGESVVYLTVNRNKRSVALDLKTEEGARAARRLALRSDVVIQSFRPGTIDRLGLGYDALSAKNTGLIYCSISAFGEDGPGRDLAGYDPLIQAFSGLMSMTGEAEGPPVRVAASITDLSTGLYAVIAILSALEKRRETGRGLRVEVSLLDSLMSMLNHQITSVLATGKVPQRMGSASPVAAPYQAIQAADGHVMVAAANNSLFARLAAGVGAPELPQDPRFSTVAGRVANLPDLIEALEEHTRQQSVRHWFEVLTAAGVPCGPVNDLGQALKDPLIAGRGVLAAVPGHPAVPDLHVVDLPFRVEGQTMGPHLAPPTLGQSTEEVLAWLDAEESTADGAPRAALLETESKK